MVSRSSSQQRSRSKRSFRYELAKDLAFIAIGVAVALILSRSGTLDAVLGGLGHTALAAFIAGIFFTSAFTLGPASIALSIIAKGAPMNTVVLWGALGALCGDLILFFFIRDKFAEDLKRSLRPTLVRHIFSSFHFGFMKWVSPVLGAFIIASPLPDEFGLALMGISRVRLAVLVPLSLVMNALGIYWLVWFAGIV